MKRMFTLSLLKFTGPVDLLTSFISPPSSKWQEADRILSAAPSSPLRKQEIENLRSVTCRGRCALGLVPALLPLSPGPSCVQVLHSGLQCLRGSGSGGQRDGSEPRRAAAPAAQGLRIAQVSGAGGGSQSDELLLDSQSVSVREKGISITLTILIMCVLFSLVKT